MSVVHDLHSHSTASDGTLSPRSLVQKAVAGGVGVLALTDHDTTDGLAEARSAARNTDLQVVPGVEISVTWNGQTIHILGLAVNPDDSTLQNGLRSLRRFRVWRAEEIGTRLARAGYPDMLESATACAGGQIISRTHFAHALVEQGHADSIRKVFRKFLVRGKPGYVPGEWCALDQALAWIGSAGGLPVIAHPARYGLRRTRLRQLLHDFSDGGGLGLEVISGSHSIDDANNMAALAEEMQLLASAGSDYHGPEKPWVELGRLHPLPPQCKPLWQSSEWEDALRRVELPLARA